MTSAVFAHVDDVAYVRRGVTCVRTHAYGESIPPYRIGSDVIGRKNDVMRAYVRRILRTYTRYGTGSEYLWP
jgi:hypothetical protein